MSAADFILAGGGLVGMLVCYFVGRTHGIDIGTDLGRQLEAEDQINRRAKYGWTVFDRSPKTFPGMSEVKAVDVRRTKR